jgi:hypothetical protein
MGVTEMRTGAGPITEIFIVLESDKLFMGLSSIAKKVTL